MISERRKIGLGENAFDPNREDLLPVDTDSVKESLQQRGEANGHLNSPNSRATQPDAVEQEIIQKVAQSAQQTRSGLTQHLVGFSESLLPIVSAWDPVALIDKIQTMPLGVESTLNDLLRKFKTETAILGPEWQNAQKDYDNFRQHHKLLRTPDYLPLKSVFLWFAMLILAESTLNVFFLWELTGILVGFAQTALITSVNVLFGAAMVGLCFRYKNHVSPRSRWLAWICIPVMFAAITFNLGVGHYRDALVEAKLQIEQLEAPVNWDNDDVNPDSGFADYTKKAMESVKNSPLAIDSVLSVLWIIVGIGFFGFATHKWYSMFDSYPGYRKRHLALKRAHGNYENLVEATRTTMNQKIQNAENRISDERTKIMNMRTRHKELVDRSKTLRENYAGWVVVLGQTQNQLLASYRDSNQQTRNEPAPKHFNQQTSIDNTLIEPPEFNPPDLGNMESVVDAVRLAEEKAQEISSTIWLQFGQLADMQSNMHTSHPNTP